MGIILKNVKGVPHSMNEKRTKSADQIIYGIINTLSETLQK